MGRAEGYGPYNCSIDMIEVEVVVVKVVLVIVVVVVVVVDVVDIGSATVNPNQR